MLSGPRAAPVSRKSGPFAWNGVFCFWLPLTVFAAWFVVMLIVLRKAILRQGAPSVVAA